MIVEIGSKYSGPPLDRPCLRHLPQGWVLEEAKQPWWLWLAHGLLRLIRG